ncbi:hypothetical protein INR49_017409 [Caranx melampygus]|nr:hypothetical protein INR49_017409 [Caranx melampygus]
MWLGLLCSSPDFLPRRGTDSAFIPPCACPCPCSGWGDPVVLPCIHDIFGLVDGSGGRGLGLPEPLVEPSLSEDLSSGCSLPSGLVTLVSFREVYSPASSSLGTASGFSAAGLGLRFSLLSVTDSVDHWQVEEKDSWDDQEEGEGCSATEGGSMKLQLKVFSGSWWATENRKQTQKPKGSLPCSSRQIDSQRRRNAGQLTYAETSAKLRGSSLRRLDATVIPPYIEANTQRGIIDTSQLQRSTTVAL